eukprot:875817-Rhodomonas_salina.3
MSSQQRRGARGSTLGPRRALPGTYHGPRRGRCANRPLCPGFAAYVSIASSTDRRAVSMMEADLRQPCGASPRSLPPSWSHETRSQLRASHSRNVGMNRIVCLQSIIESASPWQ